MTKTDIEPTEVLAEPPLPTPPAAQPSDAEQQADQVVPQEAAPVVPQEAAPVVPQQADQAMPHNPYAQSHVVPQQADQVVPQQAEREVKQDQASVQNGPVLELRELSSETFYGQRTIAELEAVLQAEEIEHQVTAGQEQLSPAAPVVPQQADQAMPHNPYAQSHVVPQQADQVAGTSPAQEERQVITFDLSDGRLPPPKFIPTAQEMYAELWEVGQRLLDEGLAQKGTAHGAAIVGSGADLLARAAEGMQQCEIPGAARNFFDGILASLNSAIAEKADIFSMLNRKPGQGGAAS